MRADRLLSLMLMLQTRGKLTASTLARELGVSRRTILRDVDALSLSGVPVYCEGGHGGGIALDEQYRTSLTGLNAGEVRSLFVATDPRPLRDLGLGDSAQRLLLKLQASLPPAQNSTAEHIRQRLMIDATWWWHEAATPPFWEDLQRAVYDDRLIEVRYETYSGELANRVLAPYSLVCKSSLWYLLAEREGELRTYRVSRFHSLHLLAQHFTRRPDFDLPAYWQAHLQDFVDAFSTYRCTLRVHPERLPFVQWLMSGRWEILEKSDARGWVTVRLALDSEALAQMLVFGLGKAGEELEPPELKTTVLAQAREVLAHLAP